MDFYILRIYCLRYVATEGQITEVKEVGRKRMQLLHDLKNRKIKFNSGNLSGLVDRRANHMSPLKWLLCAEKWR